MRIILTQKSNSIKPCFLIQLRRFSWTLASTHEGFARQQCLFFHCLGFVSTSLALHRWRLRLWSSLDYEDGCTRWRIEGIYTRVRYLIATHLRPIGLTSLRLSWHPVWPPADISRAGQFGHREKKIINTSIILDHMHVRSNYNYNSSHHHTNTLHFKIVLWVIITHIVAQLLGAPASLFVQFNNSIVPSSALALLPLIINE